ncbi:hypothetical protein N658DRAFT_484973 [Parathielavia hyrcaniae]|uniref:Uncharacterized protein n=1 Tax=Parathielavia hyrcaniae TaxID=113614 RepID=A0AAN6Q3A8_9PEZI|nr:hypothetical protein N658DRAFT_484973 [Parathielavia hyrcaniae]
MPAPELMGLAVATGGSSIEALGCSRPELEVDAGRAVSTIHHHHIVMGVLERGVHNIPLWLSLNMLLLLLSGSLWQVDVEETQVDGVVAPVFSLQGVALASADVAIKRVSLGDGDVSSGSGDDDNVHVCDISAVQDVSADTVLAAEALLLLLLLEPGSQSETAADETDVVEMVQVSVEEETSDAVMASAELAEELAVPGPQPLDDSPVACQGTVELGRGNGAELGVIVPHVTTVPSTCPVPVGPPAMHALEFEKGKGAELDRMDEGLGASVPMLPVGATTLKFESGYGALLVGIVGAVPVPNHEDGADGPPATVWFVRGYGAVLLAGAVEHPVPTLGDHSPVDDRTPPVPDPRTADDVLVVLRNGKGGEVEPVAKLTGDVPVPLVAKPQVLEFVSGNGGRRDELL